MLFREFDTIAAAAYAAHAAHDATLQDRPTMSWDELGDDAKAGFRDQVMAIARGENVGVSVVFTATARAILEHNDGQGGLALERIHDLGAFLIDSELLSEDEASKGGDIVGHAKALLAELAEVKRGGVVGPIADPLYFNGPRFQALDIAAEFFPEDVVNAAEQLLPIVTSRTGGACIASLNAVRLACQAQRKAYGDLPPVGQVLNEARRYCEFIAAGGADEPVPADIEAEREEASVQ